MKDQKLQKCFFFSELNELSRSVQKLMFATPYPSWGGDRVEGQKNNVRST